MKCIKHNAQARANAEKVNKIRILKNKSFRFNILQ